MHLVTVVTYIVILGTFGFRLRASPQVLGKYSRPAALVFSRSLDVRHCRLCNDHQREVVDACLRARFRS